MCTPIKRQSSLRVDWNQSLQLLVFSNVLFLSIYILCTEARQHITSYAFNGGHDIDGEKLFICRSHKYGQIIPGKYSKSIRKCSITHNRREAQFNRYEILIRSADKNYEWVQLKKPVTNLPDNALFGGGSKSTVRKAAERAGNASAAIIDAKGELNSHSVDLLLSSDQLWGSRKRRVRRSTVPGEVDGTSSHNEWSRNWRGHMYEGVDLIRSFNGSKSLKAASNKQLQNFTEIAVDRRKCPPKQSKSQNQILPKANCLAEPHKASFYIAKCTLRTGNIISEQIGKIWWKESIQEWVASFPFGGHEIYCLDYSVLTVKG